MLFNSTSFVYFYLAVYLLARYLPASFRWALFLFASYFFYMSWEARYALLIFSATLISYYCAIQIETRESPFQKKLFLWISVISGLGILFHFKYFNFFFESVGHLLHLAGMSYALPAIELLLPVGISFYTFQIVSYTVDVYRSTIRAERHFGYYALYICFFPQLVAGPIERAMQLLPQLRMAPRLTNADLSAGLSIMAWGYFKKVVIADRLALIVDPIYQSPDQFDGGTLLLATICFGLQVYCDFSGYADIAIGVARTFGVTLSQNFRRPYFATSVTEIWRRWHITLSTWVYDYCFTPLAIQLRTWGRLGAAIALVVTFTLVGLWHGARWTFVLFGLLHGFILCLELLTRKKRKRVAKKVPVIFSQLIGSAYTLSFWIFTLILFRADSLADAAVIMTKIFSCCPPLNLPDFDILNVLYAGIGVFILFATEVYQECRNQSEQTSSKTMQYAVFSGLLFLVFILGRFDGSAFIYFQF